MGVSRPRGGVALSTTLAGQLANGSAVATQCLRRGDFRFQPGFGVFVGAGRHPGVASLALFRSNQVGVVPFSQRFRRGRRSGSLGSAFTGPRGVSNVLG